METKELLKELLDRGAITSVSEGRNLRTKAEGWAKIDDTTEIDFTIETQRRSTKELLIESFKKETTKESLA